MSMFITVPFNVIVSTALVRFYLPFTFLELTRALRKSAGVAVASVFGPLMVISLSGGLDLSISAGFAGAALALVGWLAGVWLTDHPLLQELMRAAKTLNEWRTAPRIERS